MLLLALSGGLIATGGLLGLLQPRGLLRLVAAWKPTLSYALAVVIRIAIGAILIAAAPASRWPTLLHSLGVIVLAAALVVLLLGPTRLGSVIVWWTAQPLGWTRAASVLAIALGAITIAAAL